MAQLGDDRYCFDYAKQADGTVTFSCSDDAARWRWLALPPHHPAVIQTQNFWASIGASIAFEGLEADAWTALTWTDWQIGDPDAGHAVRGVYERIEAERGPAYSTLFYDADDRMTAKMSGRGVIFRNRNFEQWREGSKAEAREAAAPDAFVYADRESLGLMDGEHPFLAPLVRSDASADTNAMDALVTRENGLAPGNPFLSGSGDHVNTTHFGEVARQAACLITGQSDLTIAGGEMTLSRYVELGTQFRLVIDERAENSLGLSLEQLGKPCAQITVHW